MKKKQPITCRYGVTYNTTLEGNKGEIERTTTMLSKSCCWVCFNHNCDEPHDEPIPDCGQVCAIWTKTPYCTSQKNS